LLKTSRTSGRGLDKYSPSRNAWVVFALLGSTGLDEER